MVSVKEDNKVILLALKSIGYIIIALMLVSTLWELIALATVKPYVPRVESILSKLYIELSQGRLLEDLMITMRRVLLSILLALISGVVLGLISARVSLGYKILRPVILATYPIPHVTLIPILLWILGVEYSKIGVISLIVFYPIAISTMEWSLRTPRDYEYLIETMGGSFYHKLRYVIIPSIIPGLLTGLRIATSTAYAVVFIAESFVLTGGVGAYIEESWHRLDYAGVYAGVILLSATGIATYTIIWLIENAYRRRIE
ncbi:MAG: ABC transporter permease subunit [Acidilobaceae archaeon]